MQDSHKKGSGMWDQAPLPDPDTSHVAVQMLALVYVSVPCQIYLRWLEIVSWCARPGPLIACAHASTPGSRRCTFNDLVRSKILQNLYFD